VLAVGWFSRAGWRGVSWVRHASGRGTTCLQPRSRLPRPGWICGLLVPAPHFPRESTSIVLAFSDAAVRNKAKDFIWAVVGIWFYFYIFIFLSDKFTFMYCKLMYCVIFWKL
jgi:hypothetical protein